MSFNKNIIDFYYNIKQKVIKINSMVPLLSNTVPKNTRKGRY